MSRIAFAELVMYIEETRYANEDQASVFKLSDFAQLYVSRMEQLGVQLDTRIHTTRLKHRLLAQFTDMRAQKKGWDVLMAFEEDIGTALSKVCELDSDNEAIHLARAARIVRSHLFGKAKPFAGFPEGCQMEFVPFLLLALVNMILEGPSIQDHSESTTSAALSIAQLMKFNSVKHKRKLATQSATVRHSTDQETPMPTYIGLMVHAHTHKRDLVDRLHSLGISISYDRVLRLSAQLGSNVCEQFHREHVVCPPKLKHKVFTCAAVDNVDHNPTSSTSKVPFHGTSISLMQHPSHNGARVDRSISTPERSVGVGSKSVGSLPHFYTDVPPVNSSIKNSPVLVSSVTSLKRDGFKQQAENDYLWLDHTRQVLEGGIQSLDNISWAAYHASHLSPVNCGVICPTALLPLFLESTHTVAMIKHSFGVVKSAVEHLNPGQTPVIAFDQPLYALAKQIQWKWPNDYGEDKFVVMFGGLHIEMAALKTVGDWLKGSGWVEALVQADIATTGTADSFLSVAHVARTRRAHQVTLAALYILKFRAYNRYCLSNGQDMLEFKQWCSQREEVCPHFQYWATVMELELCILVYICSLRQASFSMYLDALTELVPWFHALDHTNYARWIPVHLRDMAELSTKHPEIAKEFSEGNFTVRKTNRVFSAIALDQAHEQNNALIKGDGGAVGLTYNPRALRRWMIAGPEVARVIEEFHDQQHCVGGKVDTRHHDQIPSVQAAFAKDVRSLISVIEDLGNPFEEESADLLVLHSKEIADHVSVEAVRNAQKIGQEQFSAFTDECLIKRTKSLDDVIHRNKLKFFERSTKKKVNKGKQQLISLKSDVGLFSRLYIGCQTRDENLEEFFRHENQAFPPALSDGGSLHLGTKSDLLTCLEDLYEPPTETPVASSVIVDGAAIVQMLKPAASKNFAEYASDIFIPYIISQLHNASRLDLVWDRYIEDSLKGTARAKRGKGIRRRVLAGGAIPGNWRDFLRVDKNKIELFNFLSRALLDAFNQEGKQLVITNGESILSKPELNDFDSLSPCNHEEADSRMLLHANHAALYGGNLKILIRTVDTDVVVLTVSLASILGPEYEIWLAFGSGKHFRHLPAHTIAAGLGDNKAQALPMSHSLTGCDTVSSFVGHGKKTAWSVWNVMPQLTDAILTVSSAPSEMEEDVLRTIERFIILLYDRTSKCTDINKARKKLFAKKTKVKHIPPTRAALEQHAKRAIYQGGHVWGQALLAFPVLPSPTSWGWTKTENGMYEPNWTTLPEAAEACYELVSCKCKKGCVRCRKCKKAALECTALCACEGNCSQN